MIQSFLEIYTLPWKVQFYDTYVRVISSNKNCVCWTVLIKKGFIFKKLVNDLNKKRFLYFCNMSKVGYNETYTEWFYPLTLSNRLYSIDGFEYDINMLPFCRKSYSSI